MTQHYRIIQDGIALNLASADDFSVSIIADTPPPPVNVPPIANFTFVINGNVVTFTDASSDSDGTIASRLWTFGDGSAQSTTTNPIHTYPSSTQQIAYQVSLLVTDNQGATNTRTQTISIAAATIPPPTNIETTFDHLYPPTFTLSQSQAVRPIINQARPNKGSGLAIPDYWDVNHATAVYRLTNRLTEASANGSDHLGHEYSKRDYFNCNSSLGFAEDAQGYWFGYDATTRVRLNRSGVSGALPGFAGDCEPCWHPTDPNIIWHTQRGGQGLAFSAYNIATDQTTQLFNLAGKLPAGFGQVNAVNFAGEGRPSNDGRYWALMAYAGSANSPVYVGAIMYDRIADQVIGWVLGGTEPNHSMTSPLGNYMLLGFTGDSNLGCRAYPKNYQGTNQSAGIKLTFGVTEHGDVALDASGAEVYVQLDYAPNSPTEGYIRCAKLSDGTAFKLPLTHLYPVSGESTGAHISGIISKKRPGWIIASMERSISNYGNTIPAPTERYIYDRVCAVELKPTGRMLHIADPFSSAATYFNEVQATSNADGTRILFRSAFNGRAGADSSQGETFMVGLPSTAIQ